MFGRSPHRWEITVSMFAMRSWVRGFAESFEEALETVREIEWGFPIPDPGSGLPHTLDVNAQEELKLGEWLDSLAELDERERRKQRKRGFWHELTQARFTMPDGSRSDLLPVNVRIRPLTRREYRRESKRP